MTTASPSLALDSGLGYSGPGLCTPKAAPDTALVEPDPAFVELDINDKHQGGAALIVMDGLPWLRADDVRGTGVINLSTRKMIVRGQLFLSLKSVCGPISYDYDQSSGTLKVAFDPRVFDIQNINAAESSDDRLIPITRDREAHLNYVLRKDPGSTILALDGVLSTRPGTLRVSRVVGAGADRPTVSFAIEDEVRGRGYTLGDINPSGGQSGGSPQMMGILYESRPGLRPYEIYRPLPSVSGVSASPTQAALYLNGVLVHTYDLNAGPFAISDIPITSANVRAQIVLTDTLGRHVYNTDYNGQGDLLRKGGHDYQYAFGAIKTQDAFLPETSGGMALMARERFGLSNETTAGFRFERGRSLTDGSLSIDSSNPLFYVHAVRGFSNQSGHVGTTYAAELGRTIGSRASIAFRMSGSSLDYANISQPWQFDHEALGRGVNLAAAVGALQINLNVSRHVYTRAGAESAAQLSLSRMIGGRVSVFGQAGLTTYAGPQGAGKSTSIYVGANIMLPDGRTLHAGSVSTGGSSKATIGLSKSPAVEGGLSYNLERQIQGNATTGQIRYQGRYGVVEADRYSTGKLSDGSLIVSGSIVAIHNIVTLGPPISDAYAVIAPGRADLPIYHSGQYVGKTGRDGMLVTAIPSIVASRLDASLENAPANIDLEEPGATVRVRRGGGAVIRPKATVIHSIQGRLTLAGGTYPRPGPLVARNGTTQYTGVLGEEGGFYFSNLPPGGWLLIAGGPSPLPSCTASIVSAPAAQFNSDLGDIPCTAPRTGAR